MIYADTSVLVSLYLLDANTSMAVTLIRSLPQPLIYSALHRLEVQNAFALAVFRGHQTAGQADAAWRHFEADLHARVLVPTPIQWLLALRHAAALAKIETPALGTQSFDILHVACAEQLQASVFLTFDHRQHGLAAQVGLRVQP